MLNSSSDSLLMTRIEDIARLFPILKEKPYGKRLVYLDNAATTQKPLQVINSLVDYYTHYNSNIHRGVHFLSQKASQAFDEIREKVSKYINTRSSSEVVFVRGTTEAINLVASSYGSFLKPGDEILLTEMEHHSNIVPWQLIAAKQGAIIKVVPINEKGELQMDQFEKLLSSKTKIVSAVYISNSLGTINPVKQIIQKAHEFGALVVVDAAQAMAHKKVDVQELDCDFLVFSGHKMYGPMGIGVLYGKKELLEKMPPWQGGGDMISSVSFEETTYNEVPYKFEAGTPNVADVFGLGAAIDFLQSLDLKEVQEYEKHLLKSATEQLLKIQGVRIIGQAKEKSSVVSFVIEGVNSLDAGIMLDTLGIAVRTGQHCTEPVMNCLQIQGTIRASFAIYNTMEDVHDLIEGVKKVVSILKKGR